MNASVIICTRNRAESLGQTLKAMRGVCIPEDLVVELLVVDNGSTDATASIVAAAAIPNMVLRYVSEPRAGQCFARNRGLAESAGDVILFTDDDVRPSLNWIEGMVRPILEGECDAVAGGVVLPSELRLSEGVNPGWFAATAELDAMAPDRLVGANMAFGRHVLERVPGFDTELGPGALGFHDETLFARQLVGAGYRIGGRLDVTVEHCFDELRLTREGLLAIAERMGRSDAYVDYHWNHVDRMPNYVTRVRTRCGLLARRVLHWRSCYMEQQVMSWEIQRVTANAYLDQIRIERGRLRNYERFGLRKMSRSVAA